MLSAFLSKTAKTALGQPETSDL